MKKPGLVREGFRSKINRSCGGHRRKQRRESSWFPTRSFFLPPIKRLSLWGFAKWKGSAKVENTVIFICFVHSEAHKQQIIILSQKLWSSPRHFTDGYSLFEVAHWVPPTYCSVMNSLCIKSSWSPTRAINITIIFNGTEVSSDELQLSDELVFN